VNADIGNKKVGSWLLVWDHEVLRQHTVHKHTNTGQLPNPKKTLLKLFDETIGGRKRTTKGYGKANLQKKDKVDEWKREVFGWGERGKVRVLRSHGFSSERKKRKHSLIQGKGRVDNRLLQSGGGYTPFLTALKGEPGD